MPNLNAVMAVPPVITMSAANAASSIPNAVYLRALTADRGVPVLDRWRYIGCDPVRADINVMTGVAADNYPDYTAVKRGNVKTATDPGSLAFEFMFDGARCELALKGIATRLRVWVDGVPASLDLTPASPNTGSEYKHLIDFGSRALRRVRVEIVAAYLYGIRIGPNDTLYPPGEALGSTCVIMGDSYTEGTGALHQFASYAWTLARLTGLNVMPAGSGGTGYLNTNAALGRTNYRNRLQSDVIRYNPEIVIVQGSGNDTAASTAAEVEAEARYVLSTLRQALPNAKIVVVTIIPINDGVDFAAYRAAHKAAALSVGGYFIDPVAGESYDPTGTKVGPTQGRWITGAAGTNIGAPGASGNASFYTWTDNGHPSPEGHPYIARRLTDELVRLGLVERRIEQSVTQVVAPLPRPGSSVIALGDSITIGSTDAPNTYYQEGWFQRLLLTSMGRLTYSYNAGVSGNTTAQMLARLKTDVLDRRPSKCIVMGGTNDIGQGVAQSVTVANLSEIIRQLRLSRIQPFLCTVPPQDNVARQAPIEKLNLQIRALAHREEVPLIDMYAALVDPSTGGMIAGYNTDGLHPTVPAAHAAMANAAWAVMAPLSPTSAAFLPLRNNDANNLVKNGTLFVDTNADGLPDNWGQYGSGVATLSQVVVAGVPGKMFQMDMAAGNTQLRVVQQNVGSVGAGQPFAVGDRVAVMGRLQIEPGVAGINVGMKLNYDGATGNVAINNHTSALADGVFYYVGTVPTGCTGLTLNLTATGEGKVRWGQLAVHNLTANGLG